MATRMRLELTTSSVTGWRSNQLNYRAIFNFDYHAIIQGNRQNVKRNFEKN